MSNRSGGGSSGGGNSRRWSNIGSRGSSSFNTGSNSNSSGCRSSIGTVVVVSVDVVAVAMEIVAVLVVVVAIVEVGLGGTTSKLYCSIFRHFYDNGIYHDICCAMKITFRDKSMQQPISYRYIARDLSKSRSGTLLQ